MTNEEAIAIIRKEYSCVDRDCNIERSCCKCDLMMPTKEPILQAYKMAIKALEELPKRRKEAKRWKTKAAQIASKPNGWIPASERLPEAGEYVGDVAKYYLVQNEYGDMLVARYTHSGYWEQIYQLKPIGDEIVAWMPLPEPYRAESEVSDADSN